MHFLLLIARIIFGVVFIISGFFKLMDPIGTGLIVTEYLKAAHIEFLAPISIIFGLLQSVVELVVGIGIFMRLRMRMLSVVALLLSLFFTLLTLVLAIFNPISECGCFGEAIHLTNWQTFYKNLILLVCIIPIFLYRKKFKRVAPPLAEWTFLAFYGVVGLSAAIWSLYNIPFVEYGDFRSGTNISLKLDETMEYREYSTVFIYSKGGRKAEFSIDNLPDSTWIYEDSKTISTSGIEGELFNFSLRDLNDNNLTEKILDNTKPQVLIVFSDSKLLVDNFHKIPPLLEGIGAAGADAYIVTAGLTDSLSAIVNNDRVFSASLLFSDYKSLISLCRANGGAVYIRDGVIIKKWSRHNVDVAQIRNVINRDPDDVSADETILQQLVNELSIIFIFLSIIVFRYICGIIYGKKPKLIITE